MPTVPQIGRRGEASPASVLQLGAKPPVEAALLLHSAGRFTERSSGFQRLAHRSPVAPEACQAWLRGRALWDQRSPPALRAAVVEFQHGPRY